jgi:Uma2 family endonuclease
MWLRPDPDDNSPQPRAPTHEEWLRLTPEERQRIVDSLPENPVDPDAAPPEGTHHFKVRTGALSALDSYFKRRGRKVFLASDLAVYYPGEKPVAPDLFAVLDVEPHDRTTWVVDAEGRGLDFVLEVHYRGNKKKNDERNVTLYARLGIPEYFIYDRNVGSLRGFRLPSPEARLYVPIIPQHGAYHSEVLQLDLIPEAERVRFQVDGALMLETPELVMRLDHLMSESIARVAALEERLQEEEDRRTEEQNRREEEQRLREEEQRLRVDAERRLAEALAEIERLKSR